MFLEETLWIKAALAELMEQGACEVLDIGSSSIEFRTKVQPHIYQHIHRPLEQRGCAVTYADMKAAEGVDLVVDLASDSLPEGVFSKKYDLIICCNILEHVIDRNLFMRNLRGFTKPGSLVLLTVPRRYPRHEDPIDTMFRPDPQELLSFVHRFMTSKVKKQEVLSISGKEYYRHRFGRRLDYLTLRPIWNSWRYYIKPFRWQVTCVLVQITNAKSAGDPSLDAEDR